MDANRFVLADSDGNMRVVEAGSLAFVRTINRPGTSTGQMGIDFLGERDCGAGRGAGAVSVPAGSLIVVNGYDNPDRLYYLNPSGSGTVLADVALGGALPVDEAGAVGVAYDLARHSLFVLRGNSDLVSEINPSTGAAMRSFHTGTGVGEGDIAVRPGTGSLIVSGSSRALWELDPVTGRRMGNYDEISNAQLGAVDLGRYGIQFYGFGYSSDVNGYAFDGSGQLWGSTYYGGRIIKLTLPGAPTAIVTAAIDGHPADGSQASANARQKIRIIGSGYDLFTGIEFPQVPSGGEPGFVRVRADAVSSDGTMIEVVVPDTAVTGQVRISGAPGVGLYLQITPVIRPVLPADQIINFDVPVPGVRWGMFGSGFVEGRTKVTFGGVVMNDNSTSGEIDILDNSGSGYYRSNGRLDLTIPNGALAGPVRVETAGGWFQVDTIPIQAQASVGLSSMVSTATQGTPANSLLPSANTGQLITLNGFGLSGSSNIIFTAVAEDGTRGQIVVRPNSVPNSTVMTVTVPVSAVSGPVTVAGSATSISLQIVPTLSGISANALSSPGSSIVGQSGFRKAGGGG